MITHPLSNLKFADWILKQPIWNLKFDYTVINDNNWNVCLSTETHILLQFQTFKNAEIQHKSLHLDSKNMFSFAIITSLPLITPSITILNPNTTYINPQI